MSLDYSIKAFPTTYRGRVYRSRLEARWAAFFDRLGLDHEYEPYDLGLWSPDFLLPEVRLLVDIKPITELDNETWTKAVKACKATDRTEGILITRAAPVLGHVVELGWFTPSPWFLRKEPRRACLGWSANPKRPGLLLDIVGGLGEREWFTARGRCETPKEMVHGLQSYHDYAMIKWAEATNEVQYQPADDS